MANALKDIYNEEFISKIAQSIKEVYLDFEDKKFTELVFNEQWVEKTLKERMRHITLCLGDILPKDYLEALSILMQIVNMFPKNNLGCIFFPDFVEVYGLANWDASIEALALFTQHSTSEFAVRPFIVEDEEKMMKQMLEWSKHPNEHVRRLASEGSRPRLPWGMVLKSLKNNPFPILPILENLKEDESLYVRKSVANNLNDISRDHPNLVLDLAKSWYGTNAYTNWIVKHACRTLLKQGNKEAMSIFGFDSADSVSIDDFAISPEKLSIGEELHFSFKVTSNQTTPSKIRIEYKIDYVKANGSRSKKIFKVSENHVDQTKPLHYNKTHSFKDLSTRKHYCGTHTITILLNGNEMVSKDFIVE
ncbi:DNA alkylation repair protein [Gottfriedia sp. OAE603]|uniref:DNA alkylation repair protein n=1 Tax=Gottfriedia sp. OAE603 TaxID=2663872 RepID=UPI00178AF36C